MKWCIGIVSSLLVACSAAPAVVWKKNSQQRFLHSSEEVPAASLLTEALQDSTLSVVFLMEKSADGSESLSELASNGKLPVTAEKYSEAHGIFHQVSGVESTPAVLRASSAIAEEPVLSVSMSELSNKLNGAAVQEDVSPKVAKRAGQVANASVLVVSVDPKMDSAVLDQTLASTIDHDKVQTVVLAGIRSVEEVKRDRVMAAQQRRSLMKVVQKSSRRRLEDGAEEANDDMAGVYYVSITPNILAGMMSFSFFLFITWIGITCMGAISGQDVYVSKMPSVGREA
eukprot:Nitzschia sp. Nitz4//scaffold60_size111251//68031//68885//NITZ4_004153-RA/size111251-processed-gene-0.33-mRNA-1//-1//CDS//3329555582//8157//frame0